MDGRVKQELYRKVRKQIDALTEGETDEIALMATIACELHHAFEQFHWTGFYRVVEPGLLKIGPYQGGHGCLVIPFERGVCGTAARDQKPVRVDDVEAFPGHIACSSSTRSEIVIPVKDASGRLKAVLDVDSDWAASFDEIDETQLSEICEIFSR